MVRLFPPILRGGTRIWKVQFQTEGDYSYLSSSNIAELVKSINDRDRQGIGERIKFRRLFYTNSEETPYKIVIRFENREITAKVIMMKKIIR